jgi:predicted nucleotidyltransferase
MGVSSKNERRMQLLEDELRRFVEVASGELGAERVILFGSLAQALEENDPEAVGEWSDLDLVVVAETERPFYERIKHLLLRVRPRAGADVLIYTPAEWDLMKTRRIFAREEVLESGRVVYERAG